MKPVFHASLVNGPFEDPSLYVRILREGRSLLFDAGDIGKLDIGNILNISDIFITHTHIDHFIGIDTIIRAILRREEPLRIFGPKNIISCVEGKLNGYTWNLIKEYPVKIEVFEIGADTIKNACFYAKNSFGRIDNPVRPFSEVIIEEPLFKVKALHLSHQIPILAYSLEEEYHINIDKAKLEEKDLPVGPWLSEFKKAIRKGAPASTAFEIMNCKGAKSCGSATKRLGELMPIATITRGQKISYVTDVSPEEENISKIIPFVSGSDTLFCEAYFRAADAERALERHHLTTTITGRIAREAHVGNIEIMHFSPRYMHEADEIYREVEEEFRAESDHD